MNARKALRIVPELRDQTALTETKCCILDTQDRTQNCKSLPGPEESRKKEVWVFSFFKALFIISSFNWFCCSMFQSIATDTLWQTPTASLSFFVRVAMTECCLLTSTFIFTMNTFKYGTYLSL